MGYGSFDLFWQGHRSIVVCIFLVHPACNPHQLIFDVDKLTFAYSDISTPNYTTIKPRAQRDCCIYTFHPRPLVAHAKQRIDRVKTTYKDIRSCNSRVDHYKISSLNSAILETRVICSGDAKFQRSTTSCSNSRIPSN